MTLEFKFNTNADIESEIFSSDHILKAHQAFKGIIDDDQYGFFHLTSDHSHIEKTKTIFNKYCDRKFFVQVGIGGSALGPQMLLDALKKDKEREFIFLDNTDSEYIQDQLSGLDLSKALFYIVSKSGGTAETIACFAILRSMLLSQGIEEKNFNQYFVFCTDPNNGDLRELADEYNFREYLEEQWKNMETLFIRKIMGFSSIGLGYKMQMPIMGKVIRAAAEKQIHSEKHARNPARAEGGGVVGAFC